MLALQLLCLILQDYFVMKRNVFTSMKSYFLQTYHLNTIFVDEKSLFAIYNIYFHIIYFLFLRQLTSNLLALHSKNLLFLENIINYHKLSRI